MPSFCASCLADGRVMRTVVVRGRPRSICVACLDEHPRQGRYSFDKGGDEPIVRSRRAGNSLSSPGKNRN